MANISATMSQKKSWIILQNNGISFTDTWSKVSQNTFGQVPATDNFEIGCD